MDNFKYQLNWIHRYLKHQWGILLGVFVKVLSEKLSREGKSQP